MCREMGYGQSFHHGRNCCCGSHHTMGFHRHFLSKEEKKARLENYLKDLQAEAKVVEKILKELGEGA